MSTFTDKELIKEIKERIGSLDVRDNIERRAYEIALASLEAEPVVYMWDSERKDIDAPGYYRTEHLVFAESSVKQWGGRVVPLYTAPPVPVVPEEISMASKLPLMSDQLMLVGYVKGWNACRAAMLQSGNFREISETSTNSPITLTPLPGGFTIEDAKELHEDLVRSHISQALSDEKMKKKDRDADLRWIHGVIVQAAWFVKASLDALPEPLREEKGGSPTEESEAGL
ncbi:Eaa protein [Escherichia coli]|uniref:dTDP-6-deoxy-L-hexose 3-O-methyltransferase n=1 Tax=Escherichia coli TaxID=562 RepID=UPI000DA46AB6|nr:dTDP-6-deoxy-L-hexose 3-O-methyltransferase [Escherichia coli]SQY79718.1 Eaa protein [Escherichia coli]